MFADGNLHYWGGLLNSKVASRYLEFLSPTLNFQPGDIGRILYRQPTDEATVIANTQMLVRLAKQDWDSLEESWDFQGSPLLLCAKGNAILDAAFQAWSSTCSARLSTMKRLEEESNEVFIATYGLANQMTSAVLDNQIALYRPDRIGDIKRLISYAIGCMMGRYSLDKPGLIYAHSENQGFDPGQYTKFQADDDGIIPTVESD